MPAEWQVLISILEEVREKSIRDAIIFSIFTATVEALEHILLDSGAKRAFQPEGVDCFRAAHLISPFIDWPPHPRNHLPCP